MHGKQPISSHKGYGSEVSGGRSAAKHRQGKQMAPNFTGTGLRVDMAGCGMEGGSGETAESEYASDLDGRVSR